MEVLLRAAALASALGDVDAALERLEGEPLALPYYAIPVPGEDWLARAGTIARSVAASLRQKAALSENEWAAMPCLVGSSSHDIGALEDRQHPVLDPPAAFARRLADWFGVRGPAMSVSTACTSGLSALGIAADLVAAGRCRHALVLGVELANRLTVSGFAGLELLSPHAARPCDRRRDGLALGEALAALVVSTSGTWRIAALSSVLDPSGLAAPAPNEAVIAGSMREALSSAGWQAAEVDVLKLQAGGSLSADLAEGRAVRDVFGTPPRSVSFKGAIGHTLGASGPAELALLMGTLHNGRVPPTWGFSLADDAVGLDPRAGQVSAKRVLFNLAGFGGHVAALALEKST